MLTPKEKGDALELAVQPIESSILKASPSYQEKTFTIEGQKIVTVADVRHEVDIWVSVDLGEGYTALFIFECKNWEESVGCGIGSCGVPRPSLAPYVAGTGAARG